MNKAVFHNQQNVVSKFVESKGKKVLDGKKIYRKITCVESKSFGNELRFQIPRLGSLNLKQCNLRIDLPAFSGFSGGAYVRFCNNIAIRLFERFELWSGGKQVFQRFPDEIIYNLLPNIEYEKWVKLKVDIGNEDTAATRNTNGASAQNYVVDRLGGSAMR